MKKPMSSYLLMLAIGDFRHQVIASKSHIPLQLFIQPKDTAKFEATYRYSKQIFGGEPSSVEFCYRVGMDYVSCSPYRVPIARLAAAQAAISDKSEAGRTS